MDASLAILLLALSLLLSAFFSGVEIAFISGNRLKLELDKSKPGWVGQWLSFITKSPARFISTVLIGNNIALVVYGMVWGKLFDPVFEYWLKQGQIYSEGMLIAIQTLISTLVIIVFGEFIPKTIFSLNPNGLLRIVAVPIAFIQVLLYYPVSFTVGLTRFIMKSLLRIPVQDEEVNLQRTDLGYYLREISDQATEAKAEVDHEVQILRNALEFPTIKAREGMVPRPDIVGISVDATLDELREKFIATGHSKIMVYRESLDDIVGFVHSFALFKQPTSIASIVIPVHFVPETMHVKDILTQLIQLRRSVAVVVDEYGGTSGLITMEDIIEEIFGEIEDEHDAEALVEKELDIGKYVFSGRLEIDYLNEKYGLALPEDDQYETLAGYVLHHHRDIPKKDEQIAIGPHLFQITSVTRARIDEIKVFTHRQE